jgi:hypothetical protein
MWEPYERHAPFADDAEEWLNDVADAARAFHNTLIKELEPKKREATWTSESLIEGNFRTHLLPEEGRLRRFIFLVGDFVSACRAARKEFPDAVKNGFVEGQAWNRLVRNLTKFAKDRHMPTAASKGADKSKTGMASPFVAFVRELQNSFCADSRRHDASDAALAAAITLARRAKDAGR